MSRASATGFARPWAFWLGVAAVTGGVLLHLPMFLGAKGMGYMLKGMPMDPWMLIGMGLMAAGYISVLYGLAPSFSRPLAAQSTEVELEALDDAPLTKAHLKLMLVLLLGVAVDTQKPFTFTFILPGVANEYDLRSPSHPAPGHWPVALFPFIAIIGTVLGSLVWGRLGDRIGRRASILLAAVLFIGTAMCSAMPTFHWNLVACFFMGVSAGGLLPIVYSLLAEAIPARRRGLAVVLVAGLGTALGFLLASWTAHWLIPTFGWRIMWWFGIPTGLSLILLNRWIPESPRFLLAHGRDAEAHTVLRSYGITVGRRQATEPEPAVPTTRPGFASVFRKPYSGITPVLILYGLAWGLVNFGFLVWLPVYVAKSGVTAGQVTTVIAKAALFSIPGAVAVAWLYARWSTRGTLILAAALEAVSLGVFAVDGAVVTNTTEFTALLVVLLVSMWATVSALAPYAAEVYRTEIRASGSGIVAGATKLGGVVALGLAVMTWSPPGLAGAAVLAAAPAAAAALLLIWFGIETRGRRLEEIAIAPREKRQRAVTISGRTYPVILPSWKDPRLHVSFTFVWLYVLGQVEFHFRLSFPQMLAPFLTAGVIEVAYELRRKKAFIWPASALLTGNGIAFIMRIPGTRHGDWWTFHGTWIYASVAAVAMLSKYLITWRGKHVFNPSNLALVACFLILGSSRSEPLQFWWGPISPALLIVLGVIVAGALLILRRVGQLGVATLFWLTFAGGTGLLALSGHAFSANWHLGPVADGYFWKVLVTSPEVFIFLSFMITDPRTTPETARGRRIYAVAIGLLATLLIAPMQTEFAAKVALLGTLTIVCAARPLIILARERLAMPGLPHRRGAVAGLGLVSAAAFAGLVVVAGGPARAASQPASPATAGPVQVSVRRTVGVVSLDHATAERVAADAIADLEDAARAMSARDTTNLTRCSGGNYLVDLQTKITSAKGKAIAVPTYQVTTVTLRTKQAVGQAPPTVVATLSGDMTTLTYPAGSQTAQSGATVPFTHVFDLALSGGRFLIIGDGSTPHVARLSNTVSRANLSKGTPAFAQTKLVDVASRVGLGFRQGAFRYSMSYDPQAMMGGGVCWIDYNNDGWLDLFAVNSYADADLPSWEDRGGLPRSALFENQHGTFKNVSAASHADIQVKGTGCVAADLNGDGYSDLLVTTAHGIQLLWNNGDGTFTQAASASGINPAYDWYAGAAVADVNGDGRPDLFVAGYTNMLEPIKSSIAGFPTNYQGVRDLLYLNEGNTANGHARFREVGIAAGLESSHFSHGLGATFTDVNGDGRPDLYVANDEDANQLYVNEPGGPLGFHFVNQASTLGVADHNAGMGVAEGDYNLDGRPDLFITNSRSQPHAAYASEAPVNGAPRYQSEISRFATALARKETVGWGDSWVDLSNDGTLDLVLTNGAIPVTNLKKDTEPMQVLENLGEGRLTNASGIIDQQHMPKIIGRGLAAADFDNDGRMGVAVNTIGGPLVLLENTSPVGNWLDVALTGFHPDAVVTATLANGKRIVDELHAGSSYLSSEDPRAHFGLGSATTVATLAVRYPDGAVQTLHDVAGNRIVTLPRP